MLKFSLYHGVRECNGNSPPVLNLCSCLTYAEQFRARLDLIEYKNICYCWEWTPVTQVVFTVHLQVSIDISDYRLIICTQHWWNQCGMCGILTSVLSATNRYVLVYRLRPRSMGNVATIAAYLPTFSFDSVSETHFEENNLANCESCPVAVGGAPICSISWHS